MAKTKVEQWRQSRGLSYNEMAKLIGCSRTYARALCEDGTSAVAKAFRLIVLADGAIELKDLLREEDKAQLVIDGFLDGSSVEDQFLI